MRIISKMTWPEDKEFTGCLRSPTISSTPIYRPESVGSGDNSKCGAGGYLHWQVCLGLDKKGSLPTITGIFGTELHAEISRSAAATEYVWKEDTRVANTQFELGVRPIKRNDPHDWDLIWEMAVAGDLGAIRLKFEFKVIGLCEQSVLTLQSRLEWSRTCQVYWGRTGTGKSRRAWEEAGLDAYVKDPNTKFWCGYRGQELLSSMNFEEESMCLTSSDGLTVIQSTWKSKAVPVLWQPQRSG